MTKIIGIYHNILTLTLNYRQMQPKKVTIIVNGRFHAFDYASELYKKGQLKRLISTMPYFVAKRFEIGREVYVGMPVFEILKRVWRIIFKKEIPVIFYSKLFTKTALLFVPKHSDIVISFAGYSKEIFKSPKLKDTIKILDRGSTHALSTIKLNKLAAEYHNTKTRTHPVKFTNREIEEYELADKILIPSSFVKQTFIENFVAETKLLQIPYGISSQKFAGLKASTKKQQYTVLFVGQVTPFKGIGVLINAMKVVREKIPQAKLWIVGHKSPLVKNSWLNQPWIEYFGVLRGQELYDKYNEANVFCLPSYQEGLALVLTEAIFCNLPIVATPNTGVLDLVSDKSEIFIVPIGDHNRTAQKIVEILKNPNIDGLKRNKHKESYQMSWEKFCNILLYDSIHKTL